MPMIQTKTSFALSAKEQDTVKEQLGRAIELLPGKSERWLMVGFTRMDAMYFQGCREEKLAFVEVKIFGTASRQDCEKLTKEICRIYETELSIPADHIYITYEECSKWGWNGSMF